MSANQIIQRDGQVLTINIANLEIVDNETEVASLIKKGYHILRMEGNGGNPIIWRTKKPDTFVRDMRGLVWDKNMQLNPYETDHMVWQMNVELWFDGAMKSGEYINMIAKVHGITEDRVIEIAELAKKQMSSIVPKRANRAGFRRPDIHRWFCEGPKSFVARTLRK